MAKRCPLTNDVVLYIDCLDCDDRRECQNGMLDKQSNKNNSIKNDLNKNDLNKRKE